MMAALHFPVTAWTWLLAGLVWLGAARLAWLHWQRRDRNHRVALMEGLRLLVMLMLGFTLLQPEWILKQDQTETPVVAVLKDATRSMETRDVAMPSGYVTRAEWLSLQEQRDALAPLSAQARVLQYRLDHGNPDAPHPGTDLAASLEEILSGGGRLKAVLVLGDGDWTTGESPMGVGLQYRGRRIPVYSVAIGSESGVPDVEILTVAHPAYGLMGEQVAFPVVLANHMKEGIELPLRMYVDGTLVETRPLRLASDSEGTETFYWSPSSVGEHEIRFEVPVLPGEAVPENNRHELKIDVRSEQLKVLVVDSLPRWEYRYLRNALERDPGVEMHAVLLHPSLGPGGGRHYLREFPREAEQVAGYDVVFLGDVGIGEGGLSMEDAQHLRALVEFQAGGLVLLPGRRGEHLSWTQGPLADLVPVIFDAARPEGMGLRNEGNLALTTLGGRHFLTRLEDGDTEANRFTWERLPGFSWNCAVDKGRPGAQVLAVHSTIRNDWGRLPLLVTRPFGAGQTLFLGTDSAWRWRLGVEDRYHYRFWSQVVRWMAHRRHLAEADGARLVYSPENPELGDEISLQLMLPAASAGGGDGTVFSTLKEPDGTLSRLAFRKVEGGWGVYESSWKSRQTGDHVLSLDPKVTGADWSTSLNVRDPGAEKVGRPARPDVLRDLSQLTGGRSGGISSLNEMIEAISLLPEPQAIEQRVRLWASPWWGACLLSLLALYWILRKWAGLI